MSAAEWRAEMFVIFSEQVGAEVAIIAQVESLTVENDETQK